MDGRQPFVLSLPRDVVRGIERAARDARPREACGFLLGVRAGAVTRVERTHLARNRSDRPRTRFEACPEDHLAAELAAAADGLEVVGVWHSHPDGPAELSDRDRTEARLRGSHLVASFAGGAGGAGEGRIRLRSWRRGDGALVEESVRTDSVACGRRPSVPSDLRPPS